MHTKAVLEFDSGQDGKCHKASLATRRLAMSKALYHLDSRDGKSLGPYPCHAKRIYEDIR